MSESRSLRARDIMSTDVRCVGEQETLRDAARMMRDLRVGALPICGEDQRLKGVVTDRDITIRCSAEDRDPASVRAGEMGGALYWIDSEAGVEDVLSTMEREQIKRLPVIDVPNGHRLIGMISEADIAKNLGDEHIAQFVERVYATA
ncbi:MAG: CBS domain-containing protein [Streptomyces sp.]